METISIQVDPEVAQAWRQADPSQRHKYQLLLNGWMRQMVNSPALDETVQAIQQEAQAQGLTQDILDKILQDE